MKQLCCYDINFITAVSSYQLLYRFIYFMWVEPVTHITR